MYMVGAHARSTRHLVSAACHEFVRYPVLLFGTRVCFCPSSCRHPACSCLHCSAPRVLLPPPFSTPCASVSHEERHFPDPSAPRLDERFPRHVCSRHQDRVRRPPWVCPAPRALGVTSVIAQSGWMQLVNIFDFTHTRLDVTRFHRVRAVTYILPISYNLPTLLCSNRLSTTMPRQPSKRHGPAAPISTKSNSCTHFALSENRPSKKTIFSGFQKTGMLPFASEIVLKQLRELEAPARPTTPSPSPRSPHTPLTIFWRTRRLDGGCRPG